MANTRARGEWTSGASPRRGGIGIAKLLAAAFVAIAVSSLRAADTTQNFDAAGTAYVLSQNGSGPAAALVNIGGANGNILRLAQATAGTANTVAFDRTALGGFSEVVVDFDFRMTPGTGKGDGLGFALLNTANFGIAGEVTLFGCEEPSFAGSLGVGFDINQAAGELNANHVSIHFNSVKLAEFDAGACSPRAAVIPGRWTAMRSQTGNFFRHRISSKAQGRSSIARRTWSLTEPRSLSKRPTPRASRM